MKVVMNCLPAASGGGLAIIRHLVPLLADEFAANGNEILFLLRVDQADLVPDLEPKSAMWVSEPSGGWKRLIWEARRLGPLLREAGADVLFTPYQVGALASQVKNVLMLTNMEAFLHGGFSYSPRNRLRNLALQLASYRALQAADRVIAISNFTAKHLEERVGVPSHRIRMIYHGRSNAMAPVDDASADIAALGSIGMTEPFLLTCGSLLPYRRCEDVIAAFALSLDRLPPDTRLAIAGAGTDRRYRKLLEKAIAELAVGERISLLGHVPLAVMAALYRRCLTCVIASEIEACPNIAIEAMTAGCVIVSGDKLPLPEMFADAATFFRARDIEGLSSAIVRSARCLDLRRHLSQRAINRSQAFCWEQSARDTYAALTQWA